MLSSGLVLDVTSPAVPARSGDACASPARSGTPEVSDGNEAFVCSTNAMRDSAGVATGVQFRHAFFQSELRDARGPHTTPIVAGFDLSAYPLPCPLKRVPSRAGYLPVVLISVSGLGSFGIRQRQHGKNKTQGNNTLFFMARMSFVFPPSERPRK